MDYLREQAKTLEEQLQTAIGEKADRLTQQAKEVMVEYQVHRMACMKDDKTLIGNLDEKLNETVAWGNLEKNMEKYKQNPRFQAMDFFPDDARKAMKNLAEGKSDPLATVMDMQKKNLISEVNPLEQMVKNAKGLQGPKGPKGPDLHP